MADDLKLKYEVNLTKTGDGAAAAAKELQAVGAAGEKAGQGLASMGREFKTAIAAFAGAAVIRESIQAFTEQDAASRRLSGTLTAMGKNAGDTARQLQQLAQSVVLPPGASRNSVLDAITELVRNGAASSELPKLTQHVLDLAAAGMSVERAADVMGNAISGDFGKLSKILNVDFPAGAGRAQNLAEALRLVQERFGGLAAAASGGAAGQISAFSKSVTEAKEGLGELLIVGYGPYVEAISNQITKLARWVKGEIPGGASSSASHGASPPMAEAVNPSANYDPVTAQRQLADQQRALQVAAAENQIRLGSLSGSRISPIAQAGGQRDVMTGLLDEQLKAGLIKQHEYNDARKLIDHDYYMTRAQLAAQAVELEQELLGKRYGAEQARVVAVQRQYADAKQAIEARYQMEIEKAQEAGDSVDAVLERQRQAMERISEAGRMAMFAVTDIGQGLQDIGQKGIESFAHGISTTLVQAFRTGRFEFRQFASEFLAQIAQMIMQMLILATIKRSLAGTGVGAFLGFAEGGFAPRMAAAGMIAGTQTVNSATYFPQFNTVAGEAGSEVLAVLSRPRFMEIGGLASYVGSVQGQRVAMTNADDLARSAGGRGGVGGVITVQVTGTKDFEARVIDSSIEGAVVRVVNDLHTDTPVSNAVKGLTS